MIRLRPQQPSLWAGVLGEEVEDLWEPWMREADRVLEDEALVERVYEAQGERQEQSRARGRPQTPAEVVLRLLLWKHVRNWSYEVLEREVRANLVYRSFTRIGTEKVPEAKTLARIGQALGPEVIRDLQERLVEMARQTGIVPGRKMRVATTVVETNIHYPTASSLRGDGARVLTRTMKKIEGAAGGLKRKARNRMRSVGKRVLAIALASRQKGPRAEERRKEHYRNLLRLTRQILNDTQRVMEEVEAVSRHRRTGLRAWTARLQATADRVRQVVRQAKARVFRGVTRLPGKVVSLFEPHTEIIRKGQASQPTEFGKMVQLQEAENQIVTHDEVFAERPADQQLLVPAVKAHRRTFGRSPRLVAADANFYTPDNDREARGLGVQYVSIPHRTRNAERRRLQKRRWFKAGQRWRTGSQGRISVLKRRHGLNRCRYRGFAGMPRWVGLGVMADNLIQIARRLAMATT